MDMKIGLIALGEMKEMDGYQYLQDWISFDSLLHSTCCVLMSLPHTDVVEEVVSRENGLIFGR